MGKLGDKFILWVKGKYEMKGIEWKRSDSIIWGFWSRVFPFLVFIPILFWGLKFIILDYLLEKKGFEYMVGMAIIIIILRPMIMDLLVRILTFKDDMKK